MRRVATPIVGFALCATLCGAQKTPVKVYVSVDMEGISGIVHAEQTSPEGKDYGAARKWMAEDVNAVVAGLLAGGATEVVVNDSHGGMRNILPSDLHPEASLITGTPKPLVMMAGIDESYAACLLIGYHAQAGTTAAILDHTISGGTVYEAKVNGVALPELGLNALIAGSFGVPVIMLSGDAAACTQAKALLGEGVTTVAVKQALSRTAAKLVPMPEARRRLQEAAQRALGQRAQVKPYTMAAPYRFELSFLNSSQTDIASSLPGVTRIGPRTIAFTTQDYLEGFKQLRAAIAIPSTW
jgi:D-amino peptidase